MTRGISPYCENKDCWYRKMKRTYIKVIDEKKGKQKLFAVGWYCEQCGTFKADKKGGGGEE